MRKYDPYADITEITMNVGIIQLVHLLREDERYDVCAVRGICKDIHLKINRYIVEDHQKSRTVSYPRGWWQMLKQDYLPGVANYFPVKMAHQVIEAKVYYPDIAIPKENAFVKFRKY
jgi:hypothetical protein